MELKFLKMQFVEIVVISIGKIGIVEEDLANAMKNQEDGVMMSQKNISIVLSGNQRSQKMATNQQLRDRIKELEAELREEQMCCPKCGSKEWSRPYIGNGEHDWSKRSCSECGHIYEED